MSVLVYSLAFGRKLAYYIWRLSLCEVKALEPGVVRDWYDTLVLDQSYPNIIQTPTALGKVNPNP